mmetsp:Transcript_98660/g.278980  ORF Transcript_98660/g.278980 Transcript_98660/m.278980 type:complete len:248 (+) Transcript_98660:358-1101(+)
MLVQQLLVAHLLFALLLHLVLLCRARLLYRSFAHHVVLQFLNLLRTLPREANLQGVPLLTRSLGHVPIQLLVGLPLVLQDALLQEALLVHVLDQSNPLLPNIPFQGPRPRLEVAEVCSIGLGRPRRWGFSEDLPRTHERALVQTELPLLLRPFGLVTNVPGARPGLQVQLVGRQCSQPPFLLGLREALKILLPRVHSHFGCFFAHIFQHLVLMLPQHLPPFRNRPTLFHLVELGTFTVSLTLLLLLE